MLDIFFLLKDILKENSKQPWLNMPLRDSPVSIILEQNE